MGRMFGTVHEAIAVAVDGMTTKPPAAVPDTSLVYVPGATVAATCAWKVRVMVPLFAATGTEPVHVMVLPATVG